MAEQAVLVVKRGDVVAARKACRDHSQAMKQASDADEQKKTAMLKVLEPLLGIKSSQELAETSPEKLRRKARERFNAGMVELDGITIDELLDSIEKSQERRNVSWKEAFVERLGESIATSVVNQTDPTFSYRFVAP